MSDASESDSLSMLASSESTESEADQTLIVTLILGETGAGKSTFINYLANYFLGGDLYQPKIVIPTSCYNVTEMGFAKHSEVDPTNTTIGQTKRCARYDFRRDHEVYRFIDTPGFSDPENGPSEESLVESIIMAVKEEGVLHAIIMVLNGTVTRYTINIKSALTRIQGFLPRTFFDNLIVIYTNSIPSRRPGILESLFKIRPKCTFNMDNACLAWKVDSWNEGQKADYPGMWRNSMNTIEEFVPVIRQLAPKNTEEFKQILLRKNEIKSQIADCILRIQNNHKSLEQLYEWKQQLEEFELKARQTEVIMRMRGQDADFFALSEKLYEARRIRCEEEKARLQEKVDRQVKVKSNYEEELKNARDTFETKKVVKSKVRTKEKNTICTTCQSVCHKNCTVYSPRLGNPFKACVAMVGPDRSMCKCKHSYKEHVWESFVYEEVQLSDMRLNRQISEKCLQSLNEMQRKIEVLSLKSTRAQSELDIASDKLNLLDEAISLDREEEQGLEEQRQSAIEAKEKAKTELRVFLEEMLRLNENIDLIRNEIKHTEEQLNEARRLMKSYCLELREICPKYDLLEELEIIKNLHALSCRTMSDAKQKEIAEAYIDSLVTLLADERREGTLILHD